MFEGCTKWCEAKCNVKDPKESDLNLERILGSKVPSKGGKPSDCECPCDGTDDFSNFLM